MISVLVLALACGLVACGEASKSYELYDIGDASLNHKNDAIGVSGFGGAGVFGTGGSIIGASGGTNASGTGGSTIGASGGTNASGTGGSTIGASGGIGASGTDGSTVGGSGGIGESGSGAQKDSGVSTPTCSNGIKDSDESDVDCGGSCGDCDLGDACLDDSDCETNSCDDNICVCTPLTSCPDDSCGLLNDGCGSQIECGACPQDDQVCYQDKCCIPIDCSDVNDGCGSFDDGCGQQLDCGCQDPQICYQDTCCTPQTACPADACGSVDDGCGGTLQCGGCTDANWCGGGGTANRCGCTGPDFICDCVGDDCCVLGDAPDDTDSDGVPDCVEDKDGQDWTDKGVFNGVHVELRDQCHISPSCNDYNRLGEIRTCLAGETVRESQDQYSGWDWDNPSDFPDDPDYDFQPNWRTSPLNWQINAEGFIYLAQDGYHCFAITGSDSEACASLYFVDSPAASFGGWDSLDNATAAVAQHDTGTRCFDIKAGVYPILWHYDMDDGSSSDFHLLYCYDSSESCTPNAPLPSQMLRINP